jgi:hypothetical protein
MSHGRLSAHVLRRSSHERRVYNDTERALIKAGRPSDAKIAWATRYAKASPTERAAMLPPRDYL